MERRAFTAGEKRALGEGWLVARGQGITQDEYARAHHTTARRVREFVREFGAPQVPADAARRIVADAVAQLQRLLNAIDDVDREARPSAIETVNAMSQPALLDVAAEQAHLPETLMVPSVPPQLEQHRRSRTGAADAGAPALTAAIPVNNNTGAPTGAAGGAIVSHDGAKKEHPKQYLFDSYADADEV